MEGGDEDGIKRINIGFHIRVWEGKEGNRSRKGWKRGRRKNCGINEKEEVQRIKIYMHRLEAVEEV